MNIVYALLALTSVFAIINLVLFIISRVGGWSVLARRFPDRKLFQGREWRFRRMNLSTYAGYKNVVTIGANAEGLRFSMPWFFSAGHDPFFVPWADIVECRETTVLFFAVTQLVLRDCDYRIMLPSALAAEILQERPVPA